MNFGIHIQLDAIRCRSCGHIFFHTWTSKELGVPAIERFPIECEACGAKEGYRMSEEEITEHDREQEEEE